MKKTYITPSIRAHVVYINRLMAGSYEDIIGGGTGVPSAKEDSIFDLDDDVEEETNIFDE